MKKAYITILSGILLFAVSCTKKLDVDQPDFSVSIDPSRLVADTFTYKLGDTTTFLFSGNANNIIFYSGEPGKNYLYKDRISQLGKATLSFTSNSAFGSQTNTLQILATNKLVNYDSATIADATWTDITSRAVLPTSSTDVKSGNIDLSDIFTKIGDSLFIAFKYTGSTGSTQRTWTITNLLVQNVLPDQSYSLLSLGEDANYFKVLTNVPTPASARWVVSTSKLTLAGGNASAPDNTGWIVSKPIYADRVVDRGLNLRSINSTIPVLLDLRPGYNYRYSSVGTYRASFEAFNNTTKANKRIVKEFWIKVTP